MSTRGWTHADVDAYLARQSANAPKNAPADSGASTRAPMAVKPQTPAHAKPGGNRGKAAQPRRPNKTELRFNRDMLAGKGVYEGLTFRLPGGSRYTPDWIYESNGQLFAAEVKGPHRFPSEGRALTAFLEARAAWRSVVFVWFKWTGSEWREQHCEAVGRCENEPVKKNKKRCLTNLTACDILRLIKATTGAAKENEEITQ